MRGSTLLPAVHLLATATACVRASTVYFNSTFCGMVAVPFSFLTRQTFSVSPKITLRTQNFSIGASSPWVQGGRNRVRHRFIARNRRGDECPVRLPPLLRSRTTVRHCRRAASASANTVEAAELKIELVPCLKDNYAYLIQDVTSGLTGVVDPGEAAPVVAALKERGVTKLSFILNTHHHWDHTGGNVELKMKYKCQVVGPKADKDRIPEIDIALGEGDTWRFGSHEMHVLDTPGHTRGHVSFFFPSVPAVFSGDTLFSLGCGRLFEGTPSQMFTSIGKLSALPPSTRVFCGHEYTQSNAKFALSLEPGNEALRARWEEILRLRKDGLPTIPTTIGEELTFNPFLRTQSEEIRQSLSLSPTTGDSKVFAAIRRAKDNA
eukprot:TRINITY_DN1661_c0_g1_i1.p1 TRINITY_DN1661_c0_g1~~TRINITY_DN1661_c0_g1_i1.p1  ORF type:complete len:378 (-),score=39.92 TRINITY_DN1661_c0_g1_i1:194-1327(-)